MPQDQVGFIPQEEDRIGFVAPEGSGPGLAQAGFKQSNYDRHQSALNAALQQSYARGAQLQQQRAQIAQARMEDEQKPLSRRDKVLRLLEHFSVAFGRGLQAGASAQPGRGNAAAFGGAIEGGLALRNLRRQQEIEDFEMKRTLNRERLHADIAKATLDRENLIAQIEANREEREIKLQERLAGLREAQIQAEMGAEAVNVGGQTITREQRQSAATGMAQAENLVTLQDGTTIDARELGVTISVQDNEAAMERLEAQIQSRFDSESLDRALTRSENALNRQLQRDLAGMRLASQASRGRTMSADAARLYTAAGRGLDVVDQIKEMLNKSFVSSVVGGNGGTVSNFLGMAWLDPDILSSARSIIPDFVLSANRMESGAAISEAEDKRKFKQLGLDSVMFGKKEVALAAIERTAAQMEAFRRLLDPSADSGSVSQEDLALVGDIIDANASSLGISREEMMERLGISQEDTAEIPGGPPSRGSGDVYEFDFSGFGGR